MNELALFAGAGGGILGGHLLGWRTVCAVEWEPYPASVLCARQNDGFLPPFPIWDDIQTFDGRPWRGIVDVISGGFPCQDISAAGKGAGLTESEAECGEKWRGWLAKYDPDSYSWKTAQCSLLEESNEYLETLASPRV
jgi:site-specific DNA-cytosine methylase